MSTCAAQAQLDVDAGAIPNGRIAMKLVTESKPIASRGAYGDAVAVHPDSGFIAVVGQIEGQPGLGWINVWRLSEDQLSPRHDCASADFHMTRDLCFAESATGLLLGAYRGLLHLDLANPGKPTLVGPPSEINAIARLKDGRLALASCHVIVVRDATGANEELACEQKTYDGLSRLSVSPDGAYAATSGPGPYTRLFDLSTGKQKKRISKARGPVAFSPDGLLAYTGARWRTVYICAHNKSKLSPVAEATNTTLAAGDLDFSPDGLLACARNKPQIGETGGVLEVVDPKTGTVLDSMGFDDGVSRVQWMGSRIVALSRQTAMLRVLELD